mmetsp:Transcript_17869/g.25254  ORF Transcript_17869/g.25254 Transcript_17869/m.25254 type:complete len:215 (+) Transcript_17869:120-764(+)|eukprot:CAMPEP_0184855480 /NCGR_PEP_ID=MMETSP0580-20130426/719_1 /TAXON_ID=1118495 /ORGANISM="Dactyliosolen fragilissimus" /LENGTH=214 /DNA_ID=CAMNT_0027350005 /DNA_START=120 /DNA_END=764 /DNA_ORIENTATION=+
MPSQEWVLMAKLVSQIYARADSEPFRDPVDWKSLGLFDYPEIIKKPMDLGQVKRKIENKSYKNINEAADDVRQIWKNCMQYNADGSDFYLLAKNISKRFEDKFAKLLKEINTSATDNSASAGTMPSMEEKRTFAKSLYRITKEEVGKVIVDIESKCPEALTKNSAEDEVEINVDNLSPAVFHELMDYVKSCCSEGNGKKKKPANSRGTKKQRTT